MARAGLLAAGAVMTLVAILLLTFAMHWFQIFLLLVGLGTLAAGSWDGTTGEPGPAPASHQSDLRSRLIELDSMLAEGLVKPAEHKRKRQQLIDDWGKPPAN